MSLVFQALLGFYFVWLMVLFFRKEVDRFKCGASSTFRVMCFSFYYYRVTLLLYGYYLYYLYEGSQVFS